MKYARSILTLFACLVLTACTSGPQTVDAFVGTFTDSIERTHGRAAWDDKGAFRADLIVDWGGQRMLEGTLIFDVHSELARIEQSDGTVLIWDGEAAWVSPAESEAPGARFHLRTWPYFVAAPFKLRDPGSRRTDTAAKPLQDGTRFMRTMKITFDDGVGDTPDDWYIAYRDASNRLVSLAYIVTYGKAAETAEATPHAIIYEDFKRFSGVTLATKWTFHDWSDELGSHGDPVGSATLANIRFVKSDPTWFAAPEDAREDALP